jgi:hypothetical protein
VVKRIPLYNSAASEAKSAITSFIVSSVPVATTGTLILITNNSGYDSINLRLGYRLEEIKTA